jgi:hypothetical protein
MDVRVTTTDPLVDPKPQQQPNEDATPNGGSLVWDVVRGGGELCFPREVTTGQRRALAGHLLRLKIDDAQAILDELAGRMAITNVSNPIRYCLKLIEMLKEGKFVPQLGIAVAERRAAERLREQVLRARWTTPDVTQGAPSKEIPACARAAMDRLRGGPVSAPSTRDSDNAQADDPSPADDSE